MHYSFLLNTSMRTLFRLCVATVALSLSAASGAQISTYLGPTYKKAHSWFLLAEGGDQTAIDALRASASARDTWSALFYGYILQLGVGGVAVNLPGAMAAYLLAAPSSDSAKEGLTIAAYNLGLMHLWGESTPEGGTDISGAVKWFRVAALADTGGGGVLPAAMQLGVIYEQGFGRQPRNMAEAARWYAEAAKFGDPVALYKHGRILIEGEYATRSPGVGMTLLERAAQRGSREAMYYLANVFATGEDYAQKNKLTSYIWLYVAATSGRNDNIDPAFQAAVLDAQTRMQPSEITFCRVEGKKFKARYGVRPPTVRYNVPLNTPVNQY